MHFVFSVLLIFQGEFLNYTYAMAKTNPNSTEHCEILNIKYINRCQNRKLVKWKTRDISKRRWNDINHKIPQQKVQEDCGKVHKMKVGL